jgi:hypothetical protein
MPTSTDPSLCFPESLLLEHKGRVRVACALPRGNTVTLTAPLESAMSSFTGGKAGRRVKEAA